MQKRAGKLLLSGVLAAGLACGGGSANDSPVRVTDAGGIPTGQPDAGGSAGNPDAGTSLGGGGGGGLLDGGLGDGGLGDGGLTDGGIADAGVAWCNGTHCYDSSGAVPLGTPGPWPLANEQFTAAQGIQEQPVVGVTTDEAQNLWVATNAALYLMKPGQTRFSRFAAGDGLHLQSNPAIYNDDWAPPPPADTPYPYSNSALPGAASDPGITEIVGGGPNEVFVGYAGIHHWDDPYDGTFQDGLRHSGKLDRIRLATDGTLIVDRFDLVSGNTVQFWHNRYIWKMIFDHKLHPHELYVGTDHGVDRLTPDAFRYPKPGEFFHQVTLEYMSDHLHPQACDRQKCAGDNHLLLGDWRGLALAPDGNLWVGGRWAAGQIVWTAQNAGVNPSTGQLDGTASTGWFQRGGPAFKVAFGDPYCGTAGQWITSYDPTGQPVFSPCATTDGTNNNRPVFLTPYEGDTISLSATAVTPSDGTAWFASGVSYGSASNLGLASYLNGVWTYFDPVRDLGMAESNIHDMVALPDGRLVLAGPNTGLVIWDPVTHASTSLRGKQWFPSDLIERIELDTMVSPPVLHVATYGGAATLRQLP